MSEYDGPWKEALDNYFDRFLEFPLSEAHNDIDWKKGYEFLDKELQKIIPKAAQGSKVVDKLVRVHRKTGEEKWVLIHIEVQSQKETDFAKRMFQYHYRLLERYDQRVVSLAILGDDNPDWRPDSYSHQLWQCSLQFDYPTVKLLDYLKRWTELEKDANPFALMVMAHLKSLQTRQQPEERYDWKLHLVKLMYKRGYGIEDVQQFLDFIDWMMDLPKGLDIRFNNEIEQFEKEQEMQRVTSFERVGIRKGLFLGLEAILELRFGEKGLALMPEAQEIYNHEIVQTVLDKAKTASLEELRQFVAEQPRD